MATVTAYSAIQMDSPSIWYGSVAGYSSTYIALTDYSRIGLYVGTGFKYSSKGVSGGTLTGYEQYMDSYPDYFADPQYTITGLKLNANTVYTYVQSGQAVQLLNYALSSTDNISGSSSSDMLRGFAGNDAINGNDGSNMLGGDNGNYTLSSGAGEDIFIFNVKPGSTNVDTISDFASGSSTQAFSSAIFTRLAGDSDLSDNIVIGSKALDGSDYLIFNPSTNGLYYDADVSGKSKAVLVATLAGASSLDGSTDLNVGSQFLRTRPCRPPLVSSITSSHFSPFNLRVSESQTARIFLAPGMSLS